MSRQNSPASDIPGYVPVHPNSTGEPRLWCSRLDKIYRPFNLVSGEEYVENVAGVNILYVEGRTWVRYREEVLGLFFNQANRPQVL